MAKRMFDPTEQKKIGMLTPSSNTVLEPLCSRMVYGLEDIVTMHYARFKVTKISMEEDALAQFDDSPMLQAAEQLADADVDVIAWNGTSGGWLGLDADRELCRKIRETTGIPATTSMLAQFSLFEAMNIRTIHLITPYVDSINTRLIAEYRTNGIEVVNHENLGQCVNRSFSLVSQARIQEMFADVCADPADAVSVVCTNFPAMWSIPKMEAFYHLPVIDTINCVVWEALGMAGLPADIIKNSGMIFNVSKFSFGRRD